jgi:SSS family solute:Na+ symporter
MVGGVGVPTMAVILAVLIGLSLYLTFGGQITIILTDFFQGTLSNIAFLIILGFLLWRFDWSTIISAASSAPAGKSLLDPFDTTRVANFNIWYFLIQIVLVMYGTMAWQGSQAYNASAATPHESVMGRVLGAWRDSAYGLVMMLLPLCAWVVLHHADFGAQASVINGTLDEIGRIEQGHLKTQMTVPVALSVILPLGVKGLMCAVMFCGFVGNLEVSLHSWGSIFVQDVVLPFRRSALSPRAHIWLLRAAILGVALFIFVFSLVFRQTEHILMFFAITGAIYLSGAGAAIIGGLYWKYGSTAGAWGAMLLGMVLAVGTMVWRQVLELSLMPGRGLSRWLGVETVESLKMHTPNSQWMALIAAGASCALYVALSLRRPRAFNLDRMLHRGAYADPNDAPTEEKPKRWFGFRVGQNFSFSDKLIYTSTTVWTMFWFVIAAAVTAYGSFYRIDTPIWSGFWHVKIWIGFVLGIVVTLAITIGGIGDVRFMLRRSRPRGSRHRPAPRPLH